MNKWLNAGLIMMSACLGGSHVALANTSLILGQQDYLDGAIVAAGDFLTASNGEPVPFDGFIGSDATGPNFSASWTFSYANISNVIGGNLRMGIYDHDSQANGNQISSFKLNGIDLTNELNGLFETHGGANSEVNIYSIALPSNTFSDLASGSVIFTLNFSGPGLSLLPGVTNGAGLDFAQLNVLQPVPLPAAGVLFLMGLSGLVAMRRKIG